MSHDPLDYPLSRYLLFALIGLMGGLVARLQYWASNERPHCWKCALVRLTADLLTSGFCGILMFWIAVHFEWSGVIAAALAGICGHMGSRTLFLIERILIKRLETYAQIAPQEEPEKQEEKDQQES